MPYGNNSDYQSLTVDSSFAATLYTGDASEITGYVFDLFQADVSLTLDPSFAVALPGGSGFTAVDAIATFDLSASVFNNLFFITVDSSDIDNAEGNDVVFSIDGNAVQYPFVEASGASDVSMAFSNSTVKYGAVNNQYVDQSLKKDIVRHVAKSITGGYAVADIFSNEAELIADVVAQDVSLHDTLNTTIDALKSITQGYTVDEIAATDNWSDPDQLRFFQVAQSLFGINVNDSGDGGRQEALFADLSNASVDSGSALASVTVPLKFKVGDAIALRIQYDPNSSPVGGADSDGTTGLGGMGNNTIPSRSYKILIPLT